MRREAADGDVFAQPAHLDGDEILDGGSLAFGS